MEEKLPVATHSADLKIGGYTLKCHVLDDGRRIIEADSLVGFFEYLGREDTTFSPDDAMEVAKFIHNK